MKKNSKHLKCSLFNLWHIRYNVKAVLHPSLIPPPPTTGIYCISWKGFLSIKLRNRFILKNVILNFENVMLSLKQLTSIAVVVEVVA